MDSYFRWENKNVFLYFILRGPFKKELELLLTDGILIVEPSYKPKTKIIMADPNMIHVPTG